MQALPQERDCCGECTDPTTTAIPGPEGDPGAAGANGSNGEDGICCCTETTANFTMPAELNTVVIAVLDNRSFFVGQTIEIEGAGWFEVTSVPGGSTLSMTVRNLEDSGSGTYADNVAPGTVIASGAMVCGSGPQGPKGATGDKGADGAAGAKGEKGDTGAAGSAITLYTANSASTLKVADNALDTIAHGAGGMPSFVQIRARCETIDGAWQVGDEIAVDAFWSRNSTNEEQHKYIWGVDATNVYITSLSVGGVGPTDLVSNKDGTDLAYTASRWRWRVRSFVI